jgi:hypothetical protein
LPSWAGPVKDNITNGRLGCVRHRDS